MSEPLLARAFSKWQRLSAFREAKWGRTSVATVEMPISVLGCVGGLRGVYTIQIRQGLPRHIALATLLHEMSHAKCGWRQDVPWGTHSTEWRKTFIAAISEVTGVQVSPRFVRSYHWIDWYAERAIERTLQRRA